MKPILIIVISVILLSDISCSKKNGVGSDSILIISAHDVVGRWQIIQYVDSGMDKTSVFTSTIIQFNSDGSLSVSRGNAICSGTWFIQPNSGLDKLNIIVSNDEMPYCFLQRNWVIEDKSMTSLSLSYPHSSNPEGLVLQRS
ncbi:MAG TPA: hypothetical protein VE978_12185 [Chitinophagales bacterium]|nr:hypothetical protein [Chitinophagales bacterium]